MKLKLWQNLETASLNPKFTGSYKKEFKTVSYRYLIFSPQRFIEKILQIFFKMIF